MSFTVKCPDGQIEICSIVCEHICDGTATEYIRVPAHPNDQGDEMDDYICPECYRFHKYLNHCHRIGKDIDEAANGRNLQYLGGASMEFIREATRGMKEVALSTPPSWQSAR